MTVSLLDLAQDYLEKHEGGVTFKEIWENVVKQANLTEEEANKKMSRFFTNFMLDGRFVTLGENVWELRYRLPFEKTHIDMKDVYNDVETNDDDVEESEEKEYNKAFEEKSENEDEDGEVSSDEESESEDDNTDISEY